MLLIKKSKWIHSFEDSREHMRGTLLVMKTINCVADFSRNEEKVVFKLQISQDDVRDAAENGRFLYKNRSNGGFSVILFSVSPVAGGAGAPR